MYFYSLISNRTMTIKSSIKRKTVCTKVDVLIAKNHRLEKVVSEQKGMIARAAKIMEQLLKVRDLAEQQGSMQMHTV